MHHHVRSRQNPMKWLRFGLMAVLVLAPGRICLAADPGLEISIVIPHTEDRPGYIAWGNAERDAHFHVLLTNTSNQTERLFQEWCSWGYYALTFEITDENGHTSKARKGPHAWTMNYPAYWTISQHENFVIDVYFADRTTWGDSFWLIPGHPKGEVTLRAIYHVAPGPESEKFGVWTGEITSKPVKCVIK
jgi:hypothetical protein